MKIQSVRSILCALIGVIIGQCAPISYAVAQSATDDVHRGVVALESIAGTLKNIEGKMK